jgi:putative endonuclease
MYYVYILQSLRDKTFYKGCTSDLKRRLKEHNSGKGFYTSQHYPYKLIYYEAYLLKTDAEARERYLKTSMGMRVIKKQLSHFLQNFNQF